MKRDWTEVYLVSAIVFAVIVTATALALSFGG